jgi:phosphoribosylglycinamide formyltransferase 1
MAKAIRLGILLSGGGRTLENILSHVAQPPSAVPGSQPGAAGPQKLAAEVVLVIASREKTRGLEIAKAAGVPTHLVRPKEFSTVQAYSDAMARLLDESRVDLVCLAGFLSYWIIPDRYLGRVMNIHPALLPAFGGKGMYGHHVHEAVLARGCKVSGCTVHFVDNAYDEGPIILQRAVPAYAEDTPEALAARVFAEECIAYPEAIRLYAAGRLHLVGRTVHIDDSKHRQ